MELIIKKLSDKLRYKSKIVISTHVNPDGDAIGSSMGLCHYLLSKGHDVQVLVPNSAPNYLMWIPGAEMITFVDKNKRKARGFIENADVIFSLDYNVFHRVEMIENNLRASRAFKVLIDHHPEPEEADFDLLVSNTQTSSTAELVFEVVNALDPAYSSKAFAEAIFMGLVTDTGSFSYGCNYSSTFLAVARLIEMGLDVEDVNRKLFNNNRPERLRLLGYSLSEKLEIIEDLHLAFISLTKQELQYYDFEPGDTEGIVNYALSIKGVKMAVLITEKDSLIRLSFRSKGEVDVNEIARNEFNGGGHLKAAGGNSYLSMEETIEKLIDVYERYIKYK